MIRRKALNDGSGAPKKVSQQTSKPKTHNRPATDDRNTSPEASKEVQFELPNLSGLPRDQPQSSQTLPNDSKKPASAKNATKGGLKATAPVKNTKSYRPALPVQSRTFREQIATDRETFSQQSDNGRPVTATEIASQSGLPIRKNPGRTVSDWSQQPVPPAPPSAFRKANTHVDNYINIQNESESNFNFRTKSEAFRPSNRVSIDPEKMNIRGYLDKNRKTVPTDPGSPIMEIVDRLLGSKIINLLFEVPEPSQQSRSPRRVVHLTADEWNYQRPNSPQFLSHAHNSRGNLPQSPLPATSEKPDETGNEGGPASGSESSFQEITPAKNVFCRQELESKKSRLDKKSWVSSNLSFGFMKGGRDGRERPANL